MEKEMEMETEIKETYQSLVLKLPKVAQPAHRNRKQQDLKVLNHGQDLAIRALVPERLQSARQRVQRQFGAPRFPLNQHTRSGNQTGSPKDRAVVGGDRIPLGTYDRHISRHTLCAMEIDGKGHDDEDNSSKRTFFPIKIDVEKGVRIKKQHPADYEDEDPCNNA